MGITAASCGTGVPGITLKLVGKVFGPMRYGDQAVLTATWRDHFRCARRCGCLRNDGSAAAQPSNWLGVLPGRDDLSALLVAAIAHARLV